MKKSEIKVGSTYTARVSGKIVPVSIDAIEEDQTRGKSNGTYLRYSVTNLRTKRKLIFRSAAKFREKVVVAWPWKPRDVPINHG